MRRALVVTTSLIIAGGAWTAPAAPAAAAPPLIAMTGTFTKSPHPYPSPSAPAERRLASVTLTQNLHESRIQGSIRLQAAPTTPSTVVVYFGNLEGSNCVPDDYATYHFPSTGADSGPVRYNGATITLDERNNYAVRHPYDCATAGVRANGDVEDLMLGALQPVYGTPQIDLIAPKQVKAAPRDWVNVRVDLANGEDAPMDAEDVQLTAKGKGIKVRKLKRAQGLLTSRRTVDFQVRLTAKKRKSRTLTVTARSGTVATTRKIRIKAVKPAKKPRAGTYRFAKKADGSFRIAGGKVKGFKSRFMITCGLPNSPSYSVEEVRFPTTRIPRSGLVDAKFRKGTVTLSLKMRVRGAKITKGDIHFNNYAPICFGGKKFTAKRR